MRESTVNTSEAIMKIHLNFSSIECFIKKYIAIFENMNALRIFVYHKAEKIIISRCSYIRGDEGKHFSRESLKSNLHTDMARFYLVNQNSFSLLRIFENQEIV